MEHGQAGALETKFCPVTAGKADAETGAAGLVLGKGAVIEGYASLFGVADRGGDVVEKGAYAACLARLAREGRRIKLLWQHDPAEPIGVWDTLREDGRGLWVRGRILTQTRRGAEAAALLAAGAIDGLSIGYRTVKATRGADGARHLKEIELWEVSVVTFPMLPQARARAGAEAGSDDLARTLVDALTEARSLLA